MKSEAEVIQSMRKETGMSQKKFSDYFGIPVATLQDWEHGRRVPPDYIPRMMQKILEGQDTTLPENNEYKYK